MRPRLVLMGLLLALALVEPAEAGWGPTESFGPIRPVGSLTVGPGEGGTVRAVWYEADGCGGPCAARVRLPGGRVERRPIDRGWTAAGIDERGNVLAVQSVRRGPKVCPGRRARLGIEVRRWPAGRQPQRARRARSDCGSRRPRLVVGASGDALIVWGRRHRVVIVAATTGAGVRSIATISPRAGHLADYAASLAEDGGSGVIAYSQRGEIFAVSRPAEGPLSAPQRLGRGRGAIVSAVEPGGAALVAWTTTGAGGEFGVSLPNVLRAVVRPSATAPFGASVRIASGVVRDVIAAAGPGGSILGWDVEDAPGGVAFAPTGRPFEIAQPLEYPTAVEVDGGGIAHAISGFRGEGSGPAAVHRTGPGLYSPLEPIPGGPRVLSRAGDGTLHAVSNTGASLRFSP